MIDIIQLDGSENRVAAQASFDLEFMATHPEYLERLKYELKYRTLMELFTKIPEGTAITIKGQFFGENQHYYYPVTGLLRYEIHYAAVKEVRQEVRIITNSYRHLSDRVLTWTAIKELKLRVRAWFRKHKPYLAD